MILADTQKKFRVQERQVEDMREMLHDEIIKDMKTNTRKILEKLNN